MNERSLYELSVPENMRRANLQLQNDRRSEILAAAQRRFAQAGFHRTSMQEICAEAGMSPGNLYRYFPSKEAIIAGITERDRSQAVTDMAAVDRAPSFFEGLSELAQRYLVDRSAEEVALCIEVIAESCRNPDVAKVYRVAERDIEDRMVDMLRRGIARGEIRTDLDLRAVAALLHALADGISCRRAVDPSFKVETIVPMVVQMVRGLLAHRRDGAPVKAEEKS